MSCWLLGRDFCGTGEGGVKTGERVGVAISKGGAAKLYPHQDPNEDACLALEGPTGTLLAVADGHGGEEGARVAIEHLREAARPWCNDTERESDDAWRERLVAVFWALHEAIAALRQHDGEGKIKRAARTTLSLALLRRPEARVLTCSIGDSHVYQIGDDDLDDLAWPRDAKRSFLGSTQLGRDNIDAALCLHARPAAGRFALVLATDGLSEPGIGSPDPEALVRDAVAHGGELPDGERAPDLARRVVDETCEAQYQNGAGDNIAVAVAWCDSAARS